MRELKYIKLFEAFESEKMSKTLSYVNDESKKILLNSIKRICDSIGFPYSKLSDDYFKYLPFNRALREYGEDDGTSSVKLIKYWFNKDGEFIKVTGTNGLEYDLQQTGLKKFLNNIYDVWEDYDLVKDKLSYSEVRNLKTGDIVYGSLNGTLMIGMVLVDGTNTYIIQDVSNGSEPNLPGWSNYGRHSWGIFSEDDFVKLSLIKPKYDDSDDEIDPHLSNYSLSTSYDGPMLGRNIVKDDIRNAHFALVMDFNKLRKSDYVKVSDTKRSREESKEGSTALIDPSSIRNANIQRYMTILSTKNNLTGSMDDITNIKKTIIRILGYNSIIYLINPNNDSYIVSSIDDLVTKLFSIIEMSKEIEIGNLDDDYKDELKRLIRRTNESISTLYRKSSEQTESIRTKLESLYKLANDKAFRLGSDIIEIFNLSNELSKLVLSYINNREMKTLDDVELVIEFIKNVRDLLNSSRYKLKNYNPVIRRLSSDYSESSFISSIYGHLDSEEEMRNCKNGLESIIRIVKSKL